MKKVDICENYELQKDFKGSARILKDGKLLTGGKEYQIGRKWLDIKAQVI